MTETTIQKQEQKILEFPDQAKLMIIYDDKSLKGANNFLGVVKGLIKEVRDTFNPIVDKTHKAHKEAVIQKKKYEIPLLEAEKIIKLQIASYLSEQERIRKEKEEEARKEEEERKRVAEEKLKEAQVALNSGDAKEAERILDEEIPVSEIFIPPPPPPKLEGTSVRKIPKWRCININEVPRDMLVLDSVKITRLVKESRGQVRIPGIEVYFEDSVAMRL